MCSLHMIYKTDDSRKGTRRSPWLRALSIAKLHVAEDDEFGLLLPRAVVFGSSSDMHAITCSSLDGCAALPGYCLSG